MENIQTPNSQEPDSSVAIKRILEKHHLQETEEELVKKMFGDGGSSNGGSLMWIAIGVQRGQVPENTAAVLLSKLLNVPEKTASDIFADIKKDILPLLGKPANSVPIQEDQQPKTSPIVSSMKKESKLPKREKKLPNSTPIKPPVENLNPDTPPASNAPRKTDVYREPIE